MNISTPTMQQLLEAGVHFGHQVRRGHPRMKDFIYGARDGVHIIDLAQSEDYLKKTTEAAYTLGKSGGVMLVVGTKKQARQIVEDLAKEADTPYIVERWIGGLLTNFDEVRRNIKKLQNIKEEREKGQLSHYTKKEQLLISRKLEKFDREMGGVVETTKLPDAIFVVDGVADNIAIREAGKVGLKIFGFSDTNANPEWFDYPVPANDDGIKSIKLVCETVLRAYARGKKDGGLKVGEKKKDSKSSVEEKVGEQQEVLGGQVADEAAVLEEEVEKEILEEQERKV